MVYEAIKKLVQYGLDTGLIQERDRVYATNQILDVLGMDSYEEPEIAEGEICLEEVLKEPGKNRKETLQKLLKTR